MEKVLDRITTPRLIRTHRNQAVETEEMRIILEEKQGSRLKFKRVERADKRDRKEQRRRVFAF